MLDLRVREKPPTSCEDFEVIRISEGKYHENLHRIDECSLFMSSGLYHKDFEFVDSWDKLKIKTKVWSIIGDVCFDGIDWNEYASPVIGGGYVINKADIIRAYEEAL